MLHLVRHFGDQEDSGENCGLCDVCAPESCLARRFREPSPIERAGLERLLSALANNDGQPLGRLYRESFANESIERKTFEHLVAGLVRAGLVRVQTESFEKDGERVDYQRASLTEEGRRQRRDALGSIHLGEVRTSRKKQTSSSKKAPKKKSQAKATKDKDAARRAVFIRRARRPA
jgi:hypothetical protein